MPKKIEPIRAYIGADLVAQIIIDKLNELISVVNQLIEKDEKETN